MSQRLIRALQRGGLAAEIRPDTWGVWRSRDRRSRMIGTMSGAEIDILRLQNKLKPLGKAVAPSLIWSGAIAAPTGLPGRAPAPTLPQEISTNAYLQSILLRAPSATYRERVRRACQALIQDVALAEQGGQHLTMNWGAFGGGDRTPHRAGEQSFDVVLKSRSAARRIAALAESLGDEDLKFLRKLVLQGLTRAKLARQFAMRPALVEGRALKVLRGLIAAYDRAG